jgi:L-ascorbate metabolism protein UlaG (beta-lactamase superfamily)
MKIHYLGHSAFYIEDKVNLVIDPFITENPLAKKYGVKIEDILKKEPKYTFITHGHWDHVGDSLLFGKKGSTIVSIYEIVNFLSSKAKIKAESINFGTTVLDDISFTFIPVPHSSTFLEENNLIPLGNPGSFLINLSKKVYHLGDSYLTKDFELVKELYKPEILMIPIGGRFTMNIKEAVKAVEMLDPKLVIPMHYNTWPLIEADPYLFKKLVEELGKEVLVLNPNEEVEI